jgi:hypothetical protein
MPSDRNSFAARIIRFARSACVATGGTPMPVENQTSSQHPGFAAIISRVAFHASSLVMSGARRRSCKMGEAPALSMASIHKSTAVITVNLFFLIFN